MMDKSTSSNLSSSIIPSTYKDSSGKENDMFLLTQSKAFVILMKYSTVIGEAVMDEFERLSEENYRLKYEAKQLSPEEQMAQGLLAASKLLEEKQEIIDNQEEFIEEQEAVIKEKETLVTTVMAESGDPLVGEAAKVLGVGPQWFFKYLRDKGYMFKMNTNPISEWCDKGILAKRRKKKTDPHTGEETFLPGCTTLITPKGMVLICVGVHTACVMQS